MRLLSHKSPISMDFYSSLYVGWLSPSVWIAVVKYHKLSGVHNRHLFLTISEVGKSKTKGPANSLSGESPVPGLQTPIRLLSLHSGGEKGKASCGLFIRALIPS